VAYYRSSAGAEIDLLLESPNRGPYAIEIKRTLDPKISKGFRFACEDIKPKHRFYVLPIEDSFALDKQTQAVGIETLLASL